MSNIGQGSGAGGQGSVEYHNHPFTSSPPHPLLTPSPPPRAEQGWALLGLILALAILSIVLVSAVVPNVKFQVQRDKEAEMIYRGEQIAEAIARFYGRGRLQPLNFQAPPPPYGYLLELNKLSQGVNDGVVERRFARSSALIDALTSEEWEPVRLRDPRIAKALNAYATQPNVLIPQSYWLIAASPAPILTVPATGGTDEETPSTTPAPPDGTVGGTGTPVTTEQPPPGQVHDQPDQEGQPQQPAVPAGTGQGGAIGRGNNREQEEDDRRDPLERFFQNGKDNLPIVGVATKMKGPSVRGYKGLQNYEEWVFIYIPTQRELERSIQENQNNPNTDQNRGRQNQRDRGGNPQRRQGRNP